MAPSLVIAIIGFGSFSCFLHGCGSGSGGKDPHPLRTCSKEDPEGHALNALHKMNMGYRIDGSAPLLYTISKPIFEYCAEDVDLVPQTQTTSFSSASESAKETNDKLGLEVGVAGSYGCFSAAASASTQKVQTSNHKSVRIDKKIQSSLFHVSVTATNLFEKLTADARNTFLNEEPAAIVDRYGEFYATEAEFGGLLVSTSLIEMTEGTNAQTIKAEASASFGQAKLKVGVNSYSASATSDAKETRTLTILGGDQAPWLAVSSPDDLPKAQADWAETVSGDKMFAIKTKLKPIWKLLEGHVDAKAKEIEEHLTARWKEEQSASIDYSGDGTCVKKKSTCPKKFSLKQRKLYPGVAEAKFLCLGCGDSADNCKDKEALFDHMSWDCDGDDSSCWIDEKPVCVQPTTCCPGYTLNKGTATCEKDATIQANVTIV